MNVIIVNVGEGKGNRNMSPHKADGNCCALLTGTVKMIGQPIVCRPFLLYLCLLLFCAKKQPHYFCLISGVKKKRQIL